MQEPAGRQAPVKIPRWSVPILPWSQNDYFACKQLIIYYQCFDIAAVTNLAGISCEPDAELFGFGWDWPSDCQADSQSRIWWRAYYAVAPLH